MIVLIAIPILLLLYFVVAPISGVILFALFMASKDLARLVIWIVLLPLKLLRKITNEHIS